MLSPTYSLKFKNIILFFNRCLYFFLNGHIHNVVSTLPNIVKIDVENDNVVSTLSNVVQFNVEKRNVVPTLFYVVNFNVDIHNVVSTLVWRCATSRRHINLESTMNRHWNVCWVLNNKKIPCIPPLLHQDKCVTDFQEKANIFNNFFADQCSIGSNNSELPVTLTRKTHESLSTIDFSTDDILKIIRNLDPNKAHGHDMISIRMIEICDTSICRTLKLIFQSCLESGKFPTEWKEERWQANLKNLPTIIVSSYCW